MDSNGKRKRTSSFTGSLPSVNQEQVPKRRGSIGGGTSLPEVAQSQTKPQRHAYLPGLAAFDPNHSFAAALELRAHKTGNNAKYAPGHLFVENEDAQKSVVSLLKAKRAQTQDKTELSNIDHAILHVKVIGRGQNLGSGSDRDKLYVKGHGSPKNKDSISTTTITRRKKSGVYLERGYKQTHTADQIAQGIESVRSDLGASKLDVRLTSCGSAGGYAKTIDGDTHAVSFSGADKAETFAGSVQGKLDTLRADTYSVHGYRGDANTSFPTRAHFRTTVKDDGSTHQITELPKLFDPQSEAQTVQRPVKKTVSTQERVLRNLSLPRAPTLPPAVKNASSRTSKSYEHDKNVTEQRFETRRSKARVKIN